MSSPGSDISSLSRYELEHSTISDLKELCKKAELAVGGTKPQLVMRLYKYIQTVCIPSLHANNRLNPKLLGKRASHAASCSVCGEKGIQGDRFTCLQCPDFDLCGFCATDHDEHAMIKIPKPSNQVKVDRSRGDTIVISLGNSSNSSVSNYAPPPVSHSQTNSRSNFPSQSSVSGERTFLQCSFSDKDTVKSLGARWDNEVKKWYVPPGVDLSQFSSWIPDEYSQQYDEPGSQDIKRKKGNYY